MGERKVLNKYYPPDFDPAKLPKGKRRDHNEMKVRMMLPMSVRCKTCGNFMYKGTKFNTRKEDVAGDTYLGIQVGGLQREACPGGLGAGCNQRRALGAGCNRRRALGAGCKQRRALSAGCGRDVPWRRVAFAAVS